jgi:para-aminobenzoate synthetase / 4-amino-4-deoxychorismate lyase
MHRWHALPAAIHALVEHTPGSVLLETASPAASSKADSPSASQSRLFTAPVRVLAARQPSELPALFSEIQAAVDAGHHAAGYFTYECGAFFEPCAAGPGQPSEQPLAWFGIYNPPHIFDHRSGRFLSDPPPALVEFATATPLATETSLKTTFAADEPEYASKIALIQEKIRSGDVYQLNFTIPIQVESAASPAALYRRLHAQQPAPYSAFLHAENAHRILSFSPELFFRIDHVDGARRIATRPMKGTASRGRTTAEDRAQAAWLQSDPKNRAENIMIVDLLRNDLGRLCQFGSVRAQNLFAVERYPTLWQMTSTVTGDLRPEIGFQDIFRALFPCGSITGAPKIRAMQLIAELEHRPRGVYTGAIGFFSKQETVFNVAIRTVELIGEQGTMGVGSGIVIDSDPAEEFRECLLKAQFLTNSSNTPAHPAGESFSLIETLLWHGEYPLIELHLDRIEDSAAYFAFSFNRAQIKAFLQSHAADSLTRYSRAAGANSLIQAQKVRLLLKPDGSHQITSEPIDPPSTRPLRIRIAEERTNPQDPIYFHKTTHRPLYAQALKEAIEAGYDEVLFLNNREQITESAIHNLFVEKDGRLFTPSINCGLLPGVHRRHILETNPTAAEQILTLEDLRQADAVYLCNAVRGLRRAIVVW